MSERPLTNPPTCTCQYLTVGNRLTTHNAVDSSRCEVHGPLSALRPPTPSAPSPSLRRFLIDLRGYDVTTSDGDVAADVARLDELLVQVRSDPSSPRQAMADASPRDLAAKVLTIIDRIDDYVPCDAHNAVCEIRALLTPHPTTNKEDSDG